MWYFIIIVILIFYSISNSENLKEYEKKIKLLKRKLRLAEGNTKGENIMSKLISDIKGQKCLIKSEEVIFGKESVNVECEILDADDEWIKIRFKDKKDNLITQIIRIDILKSLELVD